MKNLRHTALLVLAVFTGACSERPYPPLVEKNARYAAPTEDQKKWALATCAILAESNSDRHGILGGCERTPKNIERWKKSLREWWNVHDRADLLRTLEWIENGGHRRDFDKFGAYVSSLSPASLEEMRNKVGQRIETRNKIDIAVRHYAQLGPKSITGWDYGRYVSLCGWGYVVGYLSEDEAWRRIMPVARTLQKTFDSWEDLGKNYLIGRQFWSHKQTDNHGDEMTRVYRKLCAEQISPWHLYPWRLDLSPAEQGTK